ncbi:hypothetical protein QQG55_27020 [Brugia pahangi]
MAKLIVYLAFVICCGGNMMQLQNMQAMAAGIVADAITDYKTDKMWDDDLLMATTQVEELTLTNYDTMENGGLFILKEKSLLLMTNTVSLMKWN